MNYLLCCWAGDHDDDADVNKKLVLWVSFGRFMTLKSDDAPL